MEGYKICPNCKAHNSSTEIECSCGCDISTVNISFESPEEEIKKEDLTEYRECPRCHFKNEPSNRKCEKCSIDISYINISSNNLLNHDLLNLEEKKMVYLQSTDGKCKIVIDKACTFIGRNYTGSEYLKDKKYVSREHLKILYTKSGIVSVENMKNTNCTYVNDTLLGSVPIILHNKDIIILGTDNVNRTDLAAYFQVVIK